MIPSPASAAKIRSSLSAWRAEGRTYNHALYLMAQKYPDLSNAWVILCTADIFGRALSLDYERKLQWIITRLLLAVPKSTSPIPEAQQSNSTATLPASIASSKSTQQRESRQETFKFSNSTKPE